MHYPETQESRGEGGLSVGVGDRGRDNLKSEPHVWGSLGNDVDVVFSVGQVRGPDNVTDAK